VLCVAAGLAGPARADQSIPAADSKSIQAVIAAQIEAFRHNDARTAFRLASPHIEAKFGSAEQFLAMVATAYPAVYRVDHYSFGPIVRDGATLVQQVGLVGADGARRVALYTMQHEGDGWRIGGCVLTADTSQAI
jgi:hypothetical protein